MIEKFHEKLSNKIMDNNSFNLKMIKIKIFEFNSFLNILRQNKIIISYEKETK